MILPTTGWHKFEWAEPLAAWVSHVAPRAIALSLLDEQRHGGTWRPGVNLLPNDGAGVVDAGPPLVCAALEGAASPPLDQAQLSACLPGYPRRDPEESDANHRFRLKRDAAHLDGLLPEGPLRRRHLREHHAYILGIPLTDHDRGASPFVIYEGSHQIMRRMLREQLPDDPTRWGEVDLTEPYQAARRTVFETCKRVEVHARPGECYLAHRLSIHGVAPWAEGAKAPDCGRLIAYFRPEVDDLAVWLNAP
ncbi:hypothetical protein [Pontivivens insulae]|uniref:Uncharacterized protein n=1 Tax=Pontivivens insulae TaxID=1639689 RepID=A0A2R8ABD5_9RHOB|nr:hypothetical protein [Pontivivens insulae]RED11304.1 hypothetical protein DFR53_3339 [Pontivivens insulae]SPF29523.1 hypothetical protein POI8812_01834 [Pontivivens insulae]